VALLDQRTTAVARTLFIFIVAGAFLYGARKTIAIFVFAVFFAYICEPLVSWLEGRRAVSRGSRRVAILEVYIVLGILCAVVALGAGPHLASEAHQLFAAAPQLFNKLASGQIARQIGSNRGWSYDTQLRLQHFLARHRSEILAWIQELGFKLGRIVTNAFWLLLIPILAVFFLKEGRALAEAAVRTLRLHPQARSFVHAALEDINTMAAHYIRAQLILAGLSTVVYTIMLGLSGVPYGVALGFFAGMLEFIPIIGPLVGAITVIGVAYLTGFHYAWALVLFFGGWRVVQDYVNSPLLMHRTVRLHPMGVIFAVLAGAEIGGFIGVYLSIPIAAALQILWRRWRAYSDAAQVIAETQRSKPRAA
jgi:predicted PurR-regulated permease PerM